MFSALRDVRSRSVWCAAVALLATAVASPAATTSDVLEIMHQADRQRGLSGPCRFQATIFPAGASDAGAEERAPTSATVVEVQANGFAQQLVFVLSPSRGDVILATPDAVWLRPRRLHRLTRIPADLRMFSGASVSDVTSIDLMGNYAALLRPATDDEPDDYVVELQSGRDGVRYPRASYRVRRADFRPSRIELMSASGKRLKSITYAEFDVVFGQTIPTKLVVEDYVYKDTSIVLMSDFQTMPNGDPNMFVPDYLLTLPDLTS